MTRNRLLALGAGIAALAIVVAVGAWYGFIRSDAPPPVSLAGAVAGLSTATASPTAAGGSTTGTATATATPADGSANGGAPATATDPESLVGDWEVVTGTDSFVGYRVVEELANFGANTAVGRTNDVTGSLTYDGSAITAVEIEADLSTLRSDDNRRDNALRRQALQTGSFPTATFVLTEPIVLDDAPADGEALDATARGDLTLHGVTREVAIPISGTLSGGRLIVIGSIEIAFADYDIAPPRAPLVLSVEDHGTMEFQLVMSPA